MTMTASGRNLAEKIKKAINDSVITASEYEEIIAAAHEDGKIDHHERILLREFQSLIQDKIVERVPG
jgi:hypothetical protein